MRVRGMGVQANNRMRERVRATNAGGVEQLQVREEAELPHSVSQRCKSTRTGRQADGRMHA